MREKNSENDGRCSGFRKHLIVSNPARNLGELSSIVESKRSVLNSDESYEVFIPIEAVCSKAGVRRDESYVLKEAEIRHTFDIPRT